MEVEILARKEINNRNWYLCKGNLSIYLQNLKPEFYEFAIQRRIVKNQYLDTLFSTIKSGDPIPMITLTTKQEKLIIKDGNKAEVEMMQVEILDGLQRTFRLWAYQIVANEYKGENEKQVSEFSKRIKGDHELFFDTGVISTNLIRNLINTGEINEVKSIFDKFDVYFFIWSGLSEREIIQKMLVLNAGQKAVSKTHQFELLFLHFYDDIISKQAKIILKREKDKNASDVKRGKREIGEFLFTSIIVALQSFVEMKPLRISTDDLIGGESDEESSYSIYESVFSKTFIEKYLEELYKLDEIVNKKEIEKGLEWFVKDTTLSGVFAAVGKYINIKENWSKEDLTKFSLEGFEALRNKIMEKGFQLNEFTAEYNVLSSRSVNIGNFIRRVVMEYTLELLQDKNPEWKQVFEKVKERR